MKKIWKTDLVTHSNTNEIINPQLENAKYVTSGFELKKISTDLCMRSKNSSTPPAAGRRRGLKTMRKTFKHHTFGVLVKLMNQLAAALWPSLPPHHPPLPPCITVRAAVLRVTVNWQLYRSSNNFSKIEGFSKIYIHIYCELASVIVAIESARYIHPEPRYNYICNVLKMKFSIIFN